MILFSKYRASGVGPACFLAVSLLVHAALLLCWNDSNEPRPASRFEVGLAPLPPAAPGNPLPPRPAIEPSPRAETAETVERPQAADPSSPPPAPLSASTPVMPRPSPPLPDSATAAGRAPQVPATVPPSVPSPNPAISSRPAAASTPRPSSDRPSPPATEAALLRPVEPQAARDQGGAAAPLVKAMPRYDRNVPPAYPRVARRRGWEGEVLLRVHVSAEGDVQNVTVERSSTHAVLDQAATRAVRRWRFHPSRLGEVPVPGEVLVPLRFSLRQS